MKALRPILDLWRRLYYRAALRSLQRKDPLHEDVPWLVLQNNRLERRA